MTLPESHPPVRRRRRIRRHGVPAAPFNAAAFTSRLLLMAACFLLAFAGVKRVADVYGFRIDLKRAIAFASMDGGARRPVLKLSDAAVPAGPAAPRAVAVPAASSFGSRVASTAPARSAGPASMLTGWTTDPAPAASGFSASVPLPAPAPAQAAALPAPAAFGGGVPAAVHAPAVAVARPAAAAVRPASLDAGNAIAIPGGNPSNAAPVSVATVASAATAVSAPATGTNRLSGFRTLAVSHTAATPPRIGANFTWAAPAPTPGSDYSWTQGGNWAGSVPPGAANQENVIFAATPTVATPSIVNVNYAVNSVTFQANAPAYTITNANKSSLTVGAGGVTNNSFNQQTLALPVNIAASQTFTTVGGLTLSGPVTLAAGSDLKIVGASGVELSGSVSGAGSITTDANASFLRMSGATSNTYTGTTTINNLAYLQKTGGAVAIPGNLTVQNSGRVFSDGGQIAPVSNLTVSGGGEITVATFEQNVAETVASLNGDVDGTVSLGSQLSTGTLFVGQGNFQGLIRDGFLDFGRGPVPSADGTTGGSLVKAGSGMLTLSHNNTYSNGTIVAGGTLVVNNVPVSFGDSGTGSGTVQILGGGRLAGFGSVAGATTIGGGEGIAALAPGDGVGRLTFLSSLTLNSNARVELELGGAVAATGYDQALIAGSMTLGGTLQVQLVNGFLPTPGEKFYVLDGGRIPVSNLAETDSIVTGGFINVAPDGSYTDAAGHRYLVNYHDTDPNDPSGTTEDDVSLTFLAVPEPGTLAWCGLGLALALGAVRRRRHLQKSAA